MPLHDYECESGHLIERYTKKPDFVPKCPTCGGEGTKIWLPTGRATGEAGNEYPKTTKDITGEEITLTDAAHERAVIADHFERTGEKIVKRDDQAWIDKQHEGMDRAGDPVYSEGSGAGTNRSWGGLPSGHPFWEKLRADLYEDEEE